MSKPALLLAWATVLAMGSPAAATITTTSYSFTASTPGPFSSINGTFTLSYDSVANSYALDALNVPIGSVTFDPLNSGIFDCCGDLYIGGNGAGNAEVTQNGTNDFVLALNRSTFDVAAFGYTYPGFNDFFLATETSLSANSGVPEPATWAMMLLGFGAVGFAVRRRRKQEPNSGSQFA